MHGSEVTMEIGARLHHLQLLSPAPEACAQFYGRAYGMQVEQLESNWLCAAPHRHLLFAEGPANRIGFAAFAFPDTRALEAYRQRVAARTNVEPNRSPLFGPDGFAVTDPQGNAIAFGIPTPTNDQSPTATPAARLQHLALRSTDPASLLPFFRDTLGFIVSDRVVDDTGRLRACFLRTDAEHHALALFDSPDLRHDHLSFETTDWTALRDWADRMGAIRVPIVWGVGRHGPGNDVFFMVRDPDGNLAEISAEIEVCTPERTEGVWPHQQRTLNLWGAAIMRS
jgi:catechol 2,3-dioxygenase-like lactoylglutathione lyase family enzyme